MKCVEPISKSPEQYSDGGKLHKAEEILGVIFPSAEESTLRQHAAKKGTEDINVMSEIIPPSPFPDYHCSYYRSNGQGMASTLLRPHPLYCALGWSDEERCGCYRELFRMYLDPELIDEIRQATNGNFVLGDARFGAEIEVMLQRRVTPGKAGRPKKQ